MCKDNLLAINFQQKSAVKPGEAEKTCREKQYFYETMDGYSGPSCKDDVKNAHDFFCKKRLCCDKWKWQEEEQADR